MSDSLAASLREQLRQSGVSEGQRVTVALSGGVDSVVLLHLTGRVAAQLGLQLSAIHVNHQLQTQAAAWVSFCQHVCDGMQIPLSVVTLRLECAGGESLEAVARAERYDAFDAFETDCLLLAQHADDQAETILLQLLRGAGVAGLAAMPARQARNGKVWLRPFLTCARREIESYARQNGLQWVEDPSNANCDFDRNFLRHRIMPQLLERFPAALETLGRTARHMAEARQLLDAHAAQAGCVQDTALALDCWRSLALEQQRNVLRYWLTQQGVRAPSERRLQEIFRQLLQSRPDSQPKVDLGRGLSLRRYRAKAWVVEQHAPMPPGLQLSWSGESRLELPERAGSLHFTSAEGSGLCARQLQGKAVTIRFRRGGERLRLAHAGPGKSLQHWFQERGIPPWQRDRIPLIYADDVLVWVAGLGAAAAYAAAAGEAGVEITYATACSRYLSGCRQA